MAVNDAGAALVDRGAVFGGAYGFDLRGVRDVTLDRLSISTRRIEREGGRYDTMIGCFLGRPVPACVREGPW